MTVFAAGITPLGTQPKQNINEHLCVYSREGDRLLPADCGLKNHEK